MELDDFNKVGEHREHALTLLQNDTGKNVLVCDDCKVTIQEIQKNEVYSRVVGYLRPISGWNKGKQAEFAERKDYIIEGRNNG